MRRLLRKGRMLARLVWRGWLHNQSRYDEPSRLEARDEHGARRPGPLSDYTTFGHEWLYNMEQSFMQVSAVSSAAPLFTVRTEFSPNLMMTAQNQNAILQRTYEQAAYRVQLEALREQQKRQQQDLLDAVNHINPGLPVSNPLANAMIKSE